MPFISVDSDNWLVVDNVYSQKSIVSDIGGIWDAVSSIWRVTFTIYNIEYLTSHLDSVSVSKDMEEKIAEQRSKEEKLDRLRDLSKSDTAVKLRIPGFNGSPYNYQRLGIMYSITNGVGVLCADEMGLGKTLQAIATALFLKSKGQAKYALCITPASLKFNWPLEIEKFTDEKYVVIDGKPDDRISQWLREDVFFYIVNYELVLEDLFGGKNLKTPERKEDEDDSSLEKRIVRYKERKDKIEKRQRILGPIRRRMWDFISIDEAQAIKNHSSARSRNTKQLRSKFRMALTGTPIDGRLEELHSIMQFVAPGLLSSKTRFFQRHVEVDYYGRVTGYKRINEVSDRIRPFYIRRLKRDVLKDLPDKIYQNRIIELTKTEKRIYNELASKGHEVTEDAEAVVAIIRCKQFCNYPAMVDDTCKDSSKMDMLRAILDEVITMNANKVLLFSQYKQTVNILVDVLDDLGLKYLRIDGDTPKKTRADMQAIFKDDKSVDLMIGTDAMSAGLNLQAANYVINYDDRWSPSIMSQREDRSHRHGQRDVVTVVNFVCRGTIEERIRKALYDKSKITAEVLGDNTDEMVLKRLGAKDMAKLL